MTRKDFVITYDIADPKRLKKVAQCLEHYAMRIQKSVFFYAQATQIDLSDLIAALIERIDETHDDIRIYHVDVAKSLTMASGINLAQAHIIV